MDDMTKEQRKMFIEATRKIGVKDHTAYAWIRDPSRLKPSMAAEIENETGGKLTTWELLFSKIPTVKSHNDLANAVFKSVTSNLPDPDLAIAILTYLKKNSPQLYDIVEQEFIKTTEGARLLNLSS